MTETSGSIASCTSHTDLARQRLAARAEKVRATSKKIRETWKPKANDKWITVIDMNSGHSMLEVEQDVKDIMRAETQTPTCIGTNKNTW